MRTSHYRLRRLEGQQPSHVEPQEMSLTEEQQRELEELVALAGPDKDWKRLSSVELARLMRLRRIGLQRTG